MRVGDRGRKQRRVIAAQTSELPKARASFDTKARPSGHDTQSRLRDQAPGAIPRNWTLSQRKKPGNRPAGAPAEVRLLYRAPTGEVFKSYKKKHSSNHSKAGQAYTVFQAPTGEKFT
ncbi:hypothetical protein WJX73_010015 [Symbiochloris irregularis]|uniref:Uncharacterized protein n=1 Tax=Symbiochloris irregularis TaxID=706552 RepID=A0AAW1NRJ7_9CHLO